MVDKMEWWSEFAQVSLEERVTPAMRIASVDCDREQYRDLLLLADEQWGMVELYLHRGEMFAAYAEDEPRTKADSALVPHRAFGCMIVTDEGVDERGLKVLPSIRRINAAVLAGLERPARPFVRTGGYSLTVRNMQRRA